MTLSGCRLAIVALLVCSTLSVGSALANTITVDNPSFETLPAGGLPFGGCGAPVASIALLQFLVGRIAESPDSSNRAHKTAISPTSIHFQTALRTRTQMAALSLKP